MQFRTDRAILRVVCFQRYKFVCIFSSVELHPFLPQPGLKKFCEEKGLLMVFT
jgi:diketogulonate reductase-like aldo/keto reductase